MKKRITAATLCLLCLLGLLLMPGRMQVMADGGTKRLKDYFIDEKIPKEERDSIPLLAEGQDILWVIGYRRSEAALVTDETSRVLKVEVWRN